MPARFGTGASALKARAVFTLGAVAQTRAVQPP